MDVQKLIADNERLRAGIAEIATRQNREAACLRTDADRAFDRLDDAEASRCRELAAVRAGVAKGLRKLLAGEDS